MNEDDSDEDEPQLRRVPASPGKRNEWEKERDAARAKVKTMAVNGGPFKWPPSPPQPSERCGEQSGERIANITANNRHALELKKYKAVCEWETAIITCSNENFEGFRPIPPHQVDFGIVDVESWQENVLALLSAEEAAMDVEPQEDADEDLNFADIDEWLAHMDLHADSFEEAHRNRVPTARRGRKRE
ncbi:uncharacterized protein EHS24_005366 [Apiotrichum porosum]|uniref:Uncharacterized protein n=1 Tax=Apiotrichum porosum TaxID=105984 RepID=A0A427XD85_9TREE|nr:uncharacterized protein EHS24_005366 [Apiotrichum porosum]RSH76788.1 hypothetical protein EHS24_005366 [Apiotrichum porosum]